MASGPTRGSVKLLLSPRSSESETIDTSKTAPRPDQKNPLTVQPAWLVYVITHHDPSKFPEFIMRKVYKSKGDAVDAFIREYTTWAGKKTGVYPACHTEEKLSKKYLVNMLGSVKALTAEDIDGEGVYSGRGQVEFAIVHRDDKDMDEEDLRQRKVIIVCEETDLEA